MKVALLGAPGAGKTKLAKSLLRRLNAEKREWTLIDGYVERLEKCTGVKFAEWGDYVQTVQVLGERWTLELEAANKGLHTITCGTIYETLIYTTARASRVVFSGNEQSLLGDRIYAESIMRALGALERETFDYDALFYLPHPNPTPDSWDLVVDAKLPEVLEGFFKYAVALNGTHKENVTNSLAVISHIRDGLEAPEDDQS